MDDEVTEDPGDLLQDRYRILDTLGRGGQAETFLAYDIQTGTRVAIKQLSMALVQEWKAIELFEREGHVLLQLDHEAIPKVIDTFTLEESIDGRNNLVFNLVQEFVDGPNLATLIQEGKRWTEAEILEVAEQVLEILSYLHGLNPPVIHRDLKPSNLLSRKSGRIALIDFGAI